LESFLEEHGAGTAFGAPIDVLLPEKLGDPVQPDVVFIRNDRLDIVGETNIERSPDLAFEVLSPSNPAHDRSLKYHLYEEAGVPDYWIVDALDRTVEVYVLQDGIYEQFGKWSDGETARSVVLEGFSVPVNELIPA